MSVAPRSTASSTRRSKMCSNAPGSNAGRPRAPGSPDRTLDGFCWDGVTSETVRGCAMKKSMSTEQAATARPAGSLRREDRKTTSPGLAPTCGLPEETSSAGLPLPSQAPAVIATPTVSRQMYADGGQCGCARDHNRPTTDSRLDALVISSSGRHVWPAEQHKYLRDPPSACDEPRSSRVRRRASPDMVPDAIPNVSRLSGSAAAQSPPDDEGKDVRPSQSTPVSTELIARLEGPHPLLPLQHLRSWRELAFSVGFLAPAAL